jgi:hypothetical protein
MTNAAKQYNGLEPELRVIDSLVDQWARETANRRPIAANTIARAMAEAEGAALAGGDLALSQESEIIDRVIARADCKTRQILNAWYRSNATTEVKARQFGYSRAAFYIHWKAALWYIRGVLVGTGIDLRPV